jgi:hypothetical protein
MNKINTLSLLDFQKIPKGSQVSQVQNLQKTSFCNLFACIALSLVPQSGRIENNPFKTRKERQKP